MLIRLSDIENNVKMRPAGYKEDVMAIGRVEGGYLVVDDLAKYTALVQKYRQGNTAPKRSGCNCHGAKPRI